jgi:hypothetical protein
VSFFAFFVWPQLVILISCISKGGYCLEGKQFTEKKMNAIVETTDIVTDTRDYENWLARFGPLYAPDLRYKHTQMANPGNPFPFFRGTYYRWIRHWQAGSSELLDVPRVLAVGDLHVENFGTWRDSDGRMCWGVNDFDETDELPYTADLVRLAASVRFARQGKHLRVKLGTACQAILDGYRECLRAGGQPFVLEERHSHLRSMAMAADRSPPRFWTRMTKLLSDSPAELPATAKSAIEQDLPTEGLDPAFRVRPRVGMGSLGKQRYVALAEWSGAWICREAKMVTPPTTSWAAGTTNTGGSRMAEAHSHAVRSADPFYHPSAVWVVRRLAPHCSRIELECMSGINLERILHAMGAETANVHLGTSGTATAILKDLEARPVDWLKQAARTMTDEIEGDWKKWRRASKAKHLQN